MDEMRRMRAQGMSNREIAESLGISYPTVLKYIGKQDEVMERMPSMVERTPKPPEGRKLMELDRIRETVGYEGFTATIDHMKQTVSFCYQEMSLSVPLDVIETFVQFAISIAYRKGGNYAQ